MNMPFFPFYVQDWLSSSSVGALTFAEKGAYIELLVRMWEHSDGRDGCYLPADDDYLARLLKVSKRQWRQLRMVLVEGPSAVFDVIEDRLVNRRLTKEWEHAQDISKKRSNAGKSSAASRNASSRANTGSTHVEQTNEQTTSDVPTYNIEHVTLDNHTTASSDTYANATVSSDAPTAPNGAGAPPRTDRKGQADITNRDIIGGLGDEYRSIDGVKPAKHDYAALGQLYTECGAQAVLEGIHALAAALARGDAVGNPMGFVASVARARDKPRPTTVPRQRGRPSVRETWDTIDQALGIPVEVRTDDH